MRIAEIVGDAYAGIWIDVLLAGFKARGHEVALILPGEGPLADRARKLDVPLQLMPLPKRMRNGLEAAGYIIKLSRWLRQWRAEVAHMHLFPGAFWARLAAWRGGTPVRATQWPGPAPLEFSHIRKLDTATAWMDTALIGGCQWTANHYRRQILTRRKAYCVPYAFDLAPFDPALDGRPIRDEFSIPQDALVISLIAYMYPLFPPAMLRRAPHLRGGIKGHEILFQAVNPVLSQRADAYFLIVGDGLKPEERGAYPAALRQMARELGLGNRVIFTGFRRDVPRILAATDISVAPSLTENMGGAIEPLLMEKPVVASRVGGLPDLVSDGATGFTVPPRDPAALAAAILRLAALSPETRRAWGRRGRQRTIELCAPERCVLALEQIFENQLSRRPRSS